MSDEFLNPAFGWEQLDSYHIRSAILAALQNIVPALEGTVFDIGCGNQPYKSIILGPASKAKYYIGIDMITDRYAHPDVGWDGTRLPFVPNSANCAVATEVLEHCPNPVALLEELYKVLVPGGLLFFTVPFLWPLHDIPFDEYRYTPFALERMLRNVGFADIQLTAHGGWDASLAQMIGLWVKQRPMAERNRRIVGKMALPITRYLLNKDRVYGFWGMITGISGTARKPVL